MLNKLFIFTGIKAVNFKYNFEKSHYTYVHFFYICPFQITVKYAIIIFKYNLKMHI